MNIEDIFRAYTAKVAQAQHYRFQMEHAADREYRRLLEQKEVLSARDDPDMEVLGQTFRFMDAATREHIAYGSYDSTVDDLISALTRHTNRQHQWFLAEVYELFEEFLNKAYATMGFRAPSLWPLEDFGPVRWTEVASKPYEWFLAKARLKKGAPLSILRHFQAVLPPLAHVVDENKIGANLLVAATLIAHMRHRIVHAGGLIQDKDEFAKQVLQRVGIAPSRRHLDFIDGVLFVNEADGAIRLLKIIRESPLPFRVHYDTFNGLAHYLLSYAHQIMVALRAELPAEPA